MWQPLEFFLLPKGPVLKHPNQWRGFKAEADTRMADDDASIFIGNVDPQVSERMLYELLVQMGPLSLSILRSTKRA